jgi:hypothetical protein
MLKKIGFSSAALFAMLTCIQPAAMFAEGRDQARYNSGYAEQRDVRGQNDRNQYRGRDERLVRDGDDRGRNDGDRDRDRNRTQYRGNDDAYRYNSFRR